LLRVLICECIKLLQLQISLQWTSLCSSAYFKIWNWTFAVFSNMPETKYEVDLFCSADV